MPYSDSATQWVISLQGPHNFRVIANDFQEMAAILHKHEISHGDLQDGNILIKQNGVDVELKLIDYDSLFVPTLQGEPEQILGLPEYQHPKRMVGSGKANEKVDYFSELVIYLSFLSLAEKPELWNRFKDKTERGLLFSKKDKNRTLQNQVVQKNTEIRQLRNDNAVALSKNRALTNQIDGSNQGTADQNAATRRLQKEKTKTFAENQRLQGQNQNLVRQNQRLRDEKKSLQSQLIVAKQNGSGKESGDDRSIDPVLPEPLKQIGEYRDEVPLATVKYTNHGIEAFKLKDYDNAVDFFKDAVQVDLTFAITHYNLGCVYLEMREYGKAINVFSEAVGVDHKFKEAYYNLGLAHLGKGAHKQAKSSIELALRIDKDYQRARALLAAIEKKQR